MGTGETTVALRGLGETYVAMRDGLLVTETESTSGAVDAISDSLVSMRSLLSSRRLAELREGETGVALVFSWALRRICDTTARSRSSMALAW